MTNQGKQIEKSGRESPAPLKRYYRLNEVAAYFDISERTVYRLLDMGDLQATRIRGCRRVSLDELKRFEALLARDGE